MHPTLLPQGRGRASIPWSILYGLSSTGVTLFKLDVGVDSGPIASQVVLPISPSETATDLYAKICQAHIQLIREAFPLLLSNNLSLTPQDSTLATYWTGRKPVDGLITSNMTVSEIDRLVRATTHPYPGAYFFKNSRKCLVWSGYPSFHSGCSPFHASDGIYWMSDYEFV